VKGGFFFQMPIYSWIEINVDRNHGYSFYIHCREGSIGPLALEECFVQYDVIYKNSYLYYIGYHEIART
jgi:hypothetical protein